MNDRLRVSNADRDRAAALLRAHFIAGRLTQDELDDRLATTLGAATLGDLHRALADLPGPPVAPHDSRLERGYRRLLALYPARYRRVHEEEMLAVLLTGAAQAQKRPGRAEAVDLIIGALRVRCQAVRGGVPGWRGALAVISAGAVLGLLAGIPFASVSQPPPTAVLNLLLQAPLGAATTQHDLPTAWLGWPPAAVTGKIADSYPVMARAARTMQPAMTVHALQSEVHISVLPHEPVMVITAQASTEPEAARAATAVADSYAAFVTGMDRVTSAISVSVAPVQRSTDVLETSGLGAICGAVMGAGIGAVLLPPRRRRLRMT
jgi:Domain of unknown function (DUF1707)